MLDITLGEIISGGAAIAVALATLFQIAPVKLNPWSALAKAVGRAINGEVIEKVDKLEKDLSSIRNDADERAAKDARVRILRFGDEILHDKLHSKEHYDQILQDITEYEHYCVTHPDFKNNTTVITTARILETYEQCLKDHSFL
jgi:hypothetical protein